MAWSCWRGNLAWNTTFQFNNKKKNKIKGRTQTGKTGW